MSHEFINPSQVHPAPGFSHAVISRGHRTVHVAGQVALDADFNVVGDNLTDQTVAAMRNLETILTETSVQWEHIVRSTIYTTHPTEFATITEAIRSVRGEDMPEPAQTIVGVTGLAIEGLLVEIECTAVLD